MISKGGFEDEQSARMAGIKALNEYNTCGQVTDEMRRAGEIVLNNIFACPT